MEHGDTPHRGPDLGKEENALSLPAQGELIQSVVPPEFGQMPALMPGNGGNRRPLLQEFGSGTWKPPSPFRGRDLHLPSPLWARRERILLFRVAADVVHYRKSREDCQENSVYESKTATGRPSCWARKAENSASEPLVKPSRRRA